MAIIMGIIADDFTGATDIACFMAENGFRVALLPGLHALTQSWDEEADAIVISLKSRSLPANQAIEQTLLSYHWLRDCAGRSRSISNIAQHLIPLQMAISARSAMH